VKKGASQKGIVAKKELKTFVTGIKLKADVAVYKSTYELLLGLEYWWTETGLGVII
jgi:hypothetical protein